ncbi:hypothetical protein [Thermomonas sp.]|uniref:hypothetical protein n=1 Tax=Thermomonas sp. TaxID=1971895 RepID=UPI00391D0FDD
MSRSTILRLALGALFAMAAGAVANRVLVDIPPTAPIAHAASQDWRIPPSPRPPLKSVDAAWEKVAPWPLPPPPEAVVGEVEDAGPVAMPVGIARSRSGARAVFAVQGMGNMLLRAGAPLPGGGKVLRVSGLSVEWIDAKGRRQRREMFNSYQIQEEVAPVPAPKQPAQKGRR